MNLSIKNAPEHVVRRLRERAARNHRSLQGELLAIVESAVEQKAPLTPTELSAEIRKLNLPRRSEVTAMIRADRDRNNR